MDEQADRSLSGLTGGDASRPDRVPDRAAGSAEGGGVDDRALLERLTQVLAEADDGQRAALFARLCALVGVPEASRRWLAFFAACDAAAT